MFTSSSATEEAEEPFVIGHKACANEDRTRELSTRLNLVVAAGNALC